MRPVFDSNGVQIYQGDVREVLRQLPDESVNCCVTSPPYWGLRDYGTALWEGGLEDCDHLAPATGSTQNKGNNGRNGTPYRDKCLDCGATRIDQQIGLEDSPVKYVSVMREVFREVRRVLRADGTLWLNMGDSYSGSWGNYHPNSPPGKHGQRLKETPRWNRPAYQSQEFLPPTANVQGLKPKDLVGVPWMLAFALREDGWYLRQDIIWSKPNPMPESVTDRCTKAHEYLFLLSKSERYYFNQDAIKEPAAWERWGDQTVVKEQQGTASWIKPKSTKELREGAAGVAIGGGMPTAEGSGSSPESRAEIEEDWRWAFGKPPGRGGANAFRGQGSNRENGNGHANREGRDMQNIGTDLVRNKRSVWEVTTQPFTEAHFATFPEDLIKPCILAGCPECGTVLDPFMGSGTTGLVARKLHCRAIGIELNPAYIEIAKRRYTQEVLDFSSPERQP